MTIEFKDQIPSIPISHIASGDSILYQGDPYRVVHMIKNSKGDAAVTLISDGNSKDFRYVLLSSQYHVPIRQSVSRESRAYIISNSESLT